MIDFNLGQGFDVIGTLNYYGFGDPVTLLTVLFPENEMELMYEILIFVRMYLSGLFVAYLLRTLGKTKISTILPACILYPFCNYALLGGIRHPMFFNWHNVSATSHCSSGKGNNKEKNRTFSICCKYSVH